MTYTSNWKRCASVDIEPDANYPGVYLVVTEEGGGEHVFWLEPGKCRALYRAGTRAVAYATNPRQHREWEQTWKRRVENLVDPMMSIANALFPKPAKKKPRNAAPAAQPPGEDWDTYYEREFGANSDSE